jgi:integrase
MKLTNASIATLACPPGKSDHTFFCDDLPGFGYRIRSSGVKRWVCQFEVHGKTRRITIGSPDLFSAEEARRIARQTLAKARLGVDAVAEKAEAKAAAALTLGSVVERYLADKEGKLRPSSMVHLKRHLRVWWKPLHRMPLNAVARKDIAAHLDGPPVAAAQARTSLMALYSWAMKRGDAESNPVIGTAVPDEHIKPRERVLTAAELVEVWRAAGDDVYGKIIKLLILCGSRRAEIGDMQWNELHQQEGIWILPAERAKNARVHVMPLASEAWAILATVPRWRDGAFVFGRKAGFQAWSLNKRLLDHRVDLAPWVIHDIRRSVATGMAEIGILPHVIEAVLSHVSGHKAGIAGVYNKASYEREMKSALALWADHVRSLVEGSERKIIPLHQ